LENTKGAIIDQVIPDSPASESDLTNGDVIVKYNNQYIEHVNDLPKLVSRTPVGKTVSLEVINREGKKVVTRIVKVTINILPEKLAQTETQVNNWLGLTLEDLTPNLIKSFSLPADITGTLITKVDPTSPFEGKFKEGDIILEINNNSLNGVSDLLTIINQSKPDDILLFYIWRDGSFFYYTYTLRETDFE